MTQSKGFIGEKGVNKKVISSGREGGGRFWRDIACDGGELSVASILLGPPGQEREGV